MQFRWDMQESDFVLASDLATERLNASTAWTAAFSALRIILWIFCATTILAAIDSFRFGPGYAGLVVLVFSAVMALVTYVALLVLWARARRRAALRAYGPFPAPCELEIRETGIRLSGRHNSADVDWSGVASVGELQQHVSITLRWGAIVLVPNRAFDTAERKRELVDVVRQRSQSVVSSA